MFYLALRPRYDYGMALPDVLGLMNGLSAEFPDFKLRKKSESFLMKVIDVLLRVLTFGRMNQFMKTFTTTVGYTVYVPESWTLMTPRGQIVVLRHEAVHMRQRRRHGAFAFSMLYLFCWLPMWRAKWRRDFEMEAYEETLRALYELGEDISNIVLRTRTIAHFTTAAYAWTWTNEEDIEEWFDATVSKIYGEKKN